jgi:hypothetical protein
MIKTSTPVNDFQTTDHVNSQSALVNQSVSESIIANLMQFSRSVEVLPTTTTGKVILVTN